VGARAAARLLMTSDRLHRVDLHDCKLGCLGVTEVGKGIMACAAGVLSLVALAFNVPENEASRASAGELTGALASLMASSLCPQELNLKANNLGLILAGDQFSQIANSLGATNNSLVSLNLSVNDLSDSFGEALGNAVSRNGTLTNLNLSTNRLEAKASTAFANAISSARCGLKILNLVNNRLGHDGGITLANAIENSAELGESAVGLLGSKGTSLDLRTNNFGKAVWPLLSACESSPAVIRLDSHLVRAYSDTSRITKLNYAEALSRPKSAKPGFGSDPLGRGVQRGSLRPSTRQRPTTAPVNAGRGKVDAFSEAAVNDVVEKQKDAQAALLNNLMAHQAWVEEKSGGDGKGGGGDGSNPTGAGGTGVWY